MRQPDGLRWHIPSIEVTPDESPALAAFLDHVEVGVAVHGYGRDGWWTRLLLGGGNRELATHVAGHLRTALPDYEVIDELDAIPLELRGVHRANPVNRCKAGGVQLELPPRVRSWTPALGRPARGRTDPAHRRRRRRPGRRCTRLAGYGLRRSSRQPAGCSGARV